MAVMTAPSATVPLLSRFITVCGGWLKLDNSKHNYWVLQDTALGLTARRDETWRISAVIQPGAERTARTISLPRMCVITLLEHDKQLQKYQSSVTTNTDNDLAFY